MKQVGLGIARGVSKLSVPVTNISKRSVRSAIINHALLSNGITSQELGWLCGLIITDGHIQKSRNRIIFGQQLSDFELLQKIIIICGSNQRIAFSIEKDGRGIANLTLYSAQIIHDVLSLFPCDVHNKAQSLGSPFDLFHNDKKYDQSSLRGFFMGLTDGDGSFAFGLGWGVVAWEIRSSSRVFLEGLQKLMQMSCDVEGRINSYQPSSGKRVNILHIKKQTDVLKFARWMYHDSEPICTRKYERFLLLKEMIEMKYTPVERVRKIRELRKRELNTKIDSYNHIISQSARHDTPYNFTPRFLQRTDLLRARIESWKNQD